VDLAAEVEIANAHGHGEHAAEGELGGAAPPRISANRSSAWPCRPSSEHPIIMVQRLLEHPMSGIEEAMLAVGVEQRDA
jgi:hypothetical protein